LVRLAAGIVAIVWIFTLFTPFYRELHAIKRGA